MVIAFMPLFVMLFPIRWQSWQSRFASFLGDGYRIIDNVGKVAYHILRGIAMMNIPLVKSPGLKQSGVKSLTDHWWNCVRDGIPAATFTLARTKKHGEYCMDFSPMLISDRRTAIDGRDKWARLHIALVNLASKQINQWQAQGHKFWTNYYAGQIFGIDGCPANEVDNLHQAVCEAVKTALTE